jgi:NAD-dependent aldehyde dehydrogenases
MDIKSIVQKQHDYFTKGETLELSFRRNALIQLQTAIKKYEAEILEALHKDLNKAPFEGYASEVGIIYTELKDAIHNLNRWNRKKKVRTPIVHFLSHSYMVSEPYGTVLILSPWNYPFQLTIAPLIGAIAGGNCVTVKPSAYSPNTSAMITKLLRECFEERYIAVVEGGREANQELLDQPFNYIFFTGSVAVGKKVMEAASKNLTPVTLELGGKSPCIVDKDANINLAAKRIIWGKTLNSGQTCVCPDYLLVHKDVKKDLLEAMKKYSKEFFGEMPCQNEEYPKIINQKHFDRLKGLLTNGKIIIGGEYNEETLQISPTILDQVTWNDPVMEEEIFGPILPVLEFEDMNDVITMVNSHPKPLALYLFTNNKIIEDQVISRVSFGGGCINDTLVHLATSYMPFGGVGESGMGGYHGKWSFDTFTHQKSIMKKSNLIDVNIRYAPYKNKMKLLKKLM